MVVGWEEERRVGEAQELSRPWGSPGRVGAVG